MSLYKPKFTSSHEFEDMFEGFAWCFPGGSLAGPLTIAISEEFIRNGPLKDFGRYGIKLSIMKICFPIIFGLFAIGGMIGMPFVAVGAYQSYKEFLLRRWPAPGF